LRYSKGAKVGVGWVESFLGRTPPTITMSFKIHRNYFFTHCLTPVLGVISVFNEFSKATVLPFYWQTHVSVLNRIVMNIIAMSTEIHFVPNHMFPKSSLPDSPFSLVTH